ncbi:hypothetical protein [Paenibacillus gallinarum]|uniref:Uncharacterized protein n=1 Tax=Paenibacillus gallinarum TaxID=2762232 RepID=A0ABR8SXW5_9BACL|nr:hypothetical protein [Paenibacillus gallinarum]MBD7968371.1 hypothetical protein [Paenibacillus gallinarum]
MVWVTLGTALFSAFHMKMLIWSVIAIFVTVTVPLISILNSIGRAEGHNELEHLFNQLLQGSTWSIYVSIGYLYLLIWWVLFFSRNKKRNNNKATLHT